VARPTLAWQERCQRGKTDVIGQHDFFFYKFPLFCNNMDSFVHNAANKTSEFLQYVLVMLAIMHALAKFKKYLVGEKFVVRIDHNNHKCFLDQKDLNESQQKWVRKIQTYDFNIEFFKGNNNSVADALSKRPLVHDMINISVDWKAHLFVEYSKNFFSCEVRDGLVIDDNLWIMDDIIYYKGQILLVPKSTFKTKVLQVCHDSPVPGHQGFIKTYRQVWERFSCKGLKKYVMSHIKE
jgi:hypothetical protein